MAVAAVAALVAGGVLAAPAVARQVVHPRDTAAYQTHLETYIDTEQVTGRPDGSEHDLAWVRAHEQEALVQGDQACAWLAEQEDAPVFDPSGSTSWGTRYESYLRESDLGASTDVSSEGKRALVAGAWHHLCWWDWRDKLAPVLDPGTGD